jgi:hypothetical protein
VRQTGRRDAVGETIGMKRRDCNQPNALGRDAPAGLSTMANEVVE